VVTQPSILYSHHLVYVFVFVCVCVRSVCVMGRLNCQVREVLVHYLAIIWGYYLIAS